MNRRSLVCTVLLVALASPICAEPDTPDIPDKYLNAVRESADNVLQYGRDTYGPKSFLRVSSGFQFLLTSIIAVVVLSVDSPSAKTDSRLAKVSVSVVGESV